MWAHRQPQPDVHNRLQHAQVLQSSFAYLISIQAPCIMALLVSSIMMLLAFGSLPTPANSLATWDYFIWCPRLVPIISCVSDDSKSVAPPLQGQNLLVPIHAYPMLNHTQFPKRVDFGRCALGTRSSRHITMQCRIPIEFEFEVSWGHPVTELSPLRGLTSGAQAVGSRSAAARQCQQSPGI